MGETQSYVKEVIIQYDYICDECDKGAEILSTGIVLLSVPPQYPHKCPNCGAEKNLLKQYPCIERQYQK